jgi:hypothetical protein
MKLSSSEKSIQDQLDTCYGLTFNSICQEFKRQYRVLLVFAIRWKGGKIHLNQKLEEREKHEL